MKKIFTKLTIAALALITASCSDFSDEGYNSLPLYDKNYSGAAMPEPGQGGDKFSDFADNPFVATRLQPTSTFSVDADGASYAIMRRYVSNGFKVDKSSVRIEEYLNYFTFDYAQPADDNTVAINAEVGQCPWNPSHKLLRLGLKGKELKESEIPLANYVFLVDVSGSMYSSDKLDLLKKGLKEMLHQLQPDDRISLITYSGEVKKLLESTPVRDISKIEHAIDKLKAEGSTNGGDALKMAYEEALANYDAKKNNRIIMGTDGDFNVGVTSTEALVEMVESYARKGIYMTCLGFGTGNLNDAMMEEISNSGNGNYNYIDCEDEMMKVFVHERQRFVSVANDVKCQITFDSTLVSQYRLIGYENRVMGNEDFKDDTKDASEIGAGQTVTALYELVMSNGTTPEPNTTFVTFDCRYKKTLDGASTPLQLKLTASDFYNKNMPSPNFHFAAGVAAYGMVLRESPYKGDATIGMARQLVEQGLSFDPQGRRAALLKLMK